MRSFRRSFWRSFALVAAVLLAPMIAGSRIQSAHLPPKPEFPTPGREFVAEYGGQGAYLAHLVYWWGLFGFGDRLRQADMILLGSSHTQFGLSARRLSEDLSARAGSPIEVFNAGLGCDTPLSFDAALLGRLDIRNRAVIADGFAYDYDPYTYACFAEFSGIGDRVQAAFTTLAVWSRFDWDWMLDGYLPRVDLRDGRVGIGRYLNEAATILDWKYGDAADLYRPDLGEQFPAAPSGGQVEIATGLPWRLASGRIPLPDAFAEIAKADGIRPVFTLVPYVLTPGFNLERYQNIERLLATRGAPSTAPFLAIPAEGLASFDGEHLTGASREAASDRLAAQLQSSGLLSSALRP